jgi:hypothetical protein
MIRIPSSKKNREINYLSNYYSRTWHQRWMEATEVQDLQSFKDIIADAIDAFDIIENLSSNRGSKYYKFKTLLAGSK